VVALDRNTLKCVLLALLIFAPLFRLVTTLAWPDNERIQYLATPSRVDVLAMGGLLAVAFREQQAWISTSRLRLGFALALIVLVSTYVFGGLDRTQFFGRVFGYSVVGSFFMITVACVLAHRDSGSTAWLRWRPLMGLGKICYGVYLLQRPVEILLGKTLASVGYALSEAALGSMPIKMAAAIVAATCSWFLFERPILGLKKRFEIQAHPQSRNVPATTAGVPELHSCQATAMGKAQIGSPRQGEA
ncbi:MAG TPA: acyltransferase family protein, partial [Lysobacter sp.]|nr:acyltransferase family protein [Lysobacter sp.]